MADRIGNELAFLVRAAAFAADRHRNQKRKGVDASPYINHPLEVARILATVGGVTDVTTLVSAVLHDTIEDTATTGEEIESEFGRGVRLLVEEVTDDKSLDKAVRKRLQVERAPALSPAAKLLKLGDKIANVRDVIENAPHDWATPRRREYLEWAERVVAGCRGVNEALEREFDAVLRKGKAALGT